MIHFYRVEHSDEANEQDKIKQLKDRGIKTIS